MAGYFPEQSELMLKILIRVVEVIGNDDSGLPYWNAARPRAADVGDRYLFQFG